MQAFCGLALTDQDRMQLVSSWSVHLAGCLIPFSTVLKDFSLHGSAVGVIAHCVLGGRQALTRELALL